MNEQFCPTLKSAVLSRFQNRLSCPTLKSAVLSRIQLYDIKICLLKSGQGRASYEKSRCNSRFLFKTQTKNAFDNSQKPIKRQITKNFRVNVVIHSFADFCFRFLLKLLQKVWICSLCNMETKKQRQRVLSLWGIRLCDLKECLYPFNDLLLESIACHLATVSAHVQQNYYFGLIGLYPRHCQKTREFPASP